MDVYDPWVSLAAMAMSTERITLGAVVFAPARRRPWKLAREAMSVDRLSNGRLVLPVGLGTLDDAGFGNVGEPTAARTRAELLDETLAILDGLWTGEPFAFEGRHYRFGPMTFRPAPVQRPRIPIWVIGAWPHERSMRRAIQWDGIIVQANGADGEPARGPEPLNEVVPWILRERAADPATSGRPFEIAVDGETPADDARRAADIAGAHADAGATWWLESPWSNGSIEFLERRIDAGPPRATEGRPIEPGSPGGRNDDHG
jgi:alkanesulfonate monooxygenase SsuD/methylene tetrahydromethanopterin reductase-like flavin-dependent oxidoreductase (luciferase family)